MRRVRPRPAVQAALDQMSTAMREAEREQERLALRLGGESHVVGWTPTLEQILEPLVRLAVSGDLTLCGHVAGWHEAAHWARWRPGRARCFACLDEVSRAVRGTVEDRRCDGCRRLSTPIFAMSVLLPASVIDLGAGPAMPVGPLNAYFGACRGCRDALLPSGQRTHVAAGT